MLEVRIMQIPHADRIWGVLGLHVPRVQGNVTVERRRQCKARYGGGWTMNALGGREVCRSRRPSIYGVRLLNFHCF